jgi:predicted nucleic acid-binding protein
MYVLDTNIISELRRARPHGGVLAWLRSVDDRHLHLSAVSFGEIQAGIERTRDADPAKAATARVHGLQVVTRNVKDFKEFGVDIVNPYAPR